MHVTFMQSLSMDESRVSAQKWKGVLRSFGTGVGGMDGRPAGAALFLEKLVI